MMNYEQVMNQLGHVFRLEALHIKDGTGKPDYVEFMPYIESISENYDSSWEEQDVYGRMDGIHSFRGVKRNISLSLKVAAANIAQARQNQDRLGKMIRFLYPTIGKNVDSIGQDKSITSNYIKSAPVFRLKFGNIIRDITENTGLYGIIKGGISITPSHMDGWFCGSDLLLEPVVKQGIEVGKINSGLAMVPEINDLRQMESAISSSPVTSAMGSSMGSAFNQAAVEKAKEFDKNRELFYYKYFVINFTFTALHNHVLGNDNDKLNKLYTSLSELDDIDMYDTLFRANNIIYKSIKLTLYN